MNSGVMGLGRVFLVAIAIVSLASSRSGATPRAAAMAAPIGLNIPNLEAYWPLDVNNAGTTPDLSPNGNTGTLTGGASLDTTQVSPVPAGNVASLLTNAAAATQEFLDIADSASLRITGPLTLAAWVRPTANTGTGDPVVAQKCIIEKWSGGGAINGYFLRLSSANAGNNVPLFSRGDGTAQDGAQDVNPLTLSTWTHVAGVFDGTNLTLYVGGVQAAQVPGTHTPTAANTANLHLAKDYGANIMTGNIDEARVYSFGATAGQIGTLVSGTQPPPTGTTATAGPGEVTVTWTAAANARSYNVYQSVNGGPFTLLANTAATTYVDVGATNQANTYSYEVTAVACLESTPDGPTTAVSPTTPPPHVGQGPSNSFFHRCGCSTVQPHAGAAFGLAAIAALFVLVRRK